MSSSSAQPLLLDEAARTRAYLEQWSASIAFELLTERRRIHLHRNIQTESLGVEEPEFVDTMPTSEQIVAAAAFRGGRPTPTPLTQPTSSAVKGQLSLSRHVLKSALHTIALATILELPTLWEAFQNGTSMTEPIRRIVATGALSALASPLLVKLQQYFEQYLPKLIESVMSAKKSVVLTSLLTACQVPLGIAVAATTSLGKAVMALWDAIGYLTARYRVDERSKKAQLTKLKSRFDLDDLCRTLSSSVAVAALSSAALPLTGSALLILQGVAFVGSQALCEHILWAKSVKGGWLDWFGDLFVRDRRQMNWAGETFDEYEDSITADLRCGISLQIVVDPVRSEHTGHIYERAAIYSWLDQRGTDPMSRTVATRLDYIPAPTARAKAYEIARYLSAVRAVVG